MEKKRYQSIDIMKGFAMIAVILVHYNQSFYDAVPILLFFQMGCQLFFVLSGFGVSVSLSKRLSKDSLNSSLKSFYFQRLRSIALPYWFMIAVVYIANTILLKTSGAMLDFGTSRNIFDILCNVLLIHGLIPSANNSVFPGGWYIGTTALLYLIAPFMFMLFQKVRSKKVFCGVSSAASFLILVIISLIFPNSQELLLNNNSFGYFSILSQFPCFCMGMLLFFVINEGQQTQPKAAVSFASGGLSLIISVVLFFSDFTKYSYILSASAVGLASFFVLYSMIYFESVHSFGKIFNPIIKIGGKTLYIYLVHGFFVWSFTKYIKSLIYSLNINADSYLTMIILLPLVFGLSYLSACILKWIISKISDCIFKPKKLNSN